MDARSNAAGPGSEGSRVFFSCCKGETHTHKSGFKQLYRRLRSMYRPDKLESKEDLSTDVLLGSSGPAVLVLGCPTQPFSTAEFAAVNAFVRGGGSLLVCGAAGGETKAGTNINYLLEEYGIAINSDAVVRTAHHKYMHPKEALISDGLLNRAIATAVGGSRHADSSDLDDGLDTAKAASNKGFDGSGLSFVYPHGCTLGVQKPAVPILSSGKISYPMQRPLGG